VKSPKDSGGERKATGTEGGRKDGHAPNSGFQLRGLVHYESKGRRKQKPRKIRGIIIVSSRPHPGVHVNPKQRLWG